MSANREHSSFPLDVKAQDSYYELYLPNDDRLHGYLMAETVQTMPWTTEFLVNHAPPRSVTVIDASKGQDTANAVNAAFARLTTICIDRNLFHVLDHKHRRQLSRPHRKVCNFALRCYLLRSLPGSVRLYRRRHEALDSSKSSSSV